MSDTTLTIGCNYEFSDDGELWDEGLLISISHRVPLTYQSLDGDKKEWYSRIRPIIAKPTYTQAMSDNGELPQVGMECSFDGESHTVMLGIDSDNELILSPCKGLLYWQRAHIDDIKPIDTRTDKEKLKEQLANYFGGDLSDLVERIEKGDFSGLTFTEGK